MELLPELSAVMEVTVDELLSGCEKDGEELSYSKAGVDIAYTDTIKKEMAKHLETGDKRVLEIGCIRAEKQKIIMENKINWQ